ncbi:hypothetical protein BCT11_16815 [Vibrio sp. 10N.222.52.B12]|jgi:hypothetical protein|nr:hypothetical protein BCT11_16815 [Vibrio sp. 10N.222.52.B12]
MPNLNFVAFLLLENRKTTDRDQLSLKNQIGQNEKRSEAFATVCWARILSLSHVTVNTEIDK